MDDIEVYDYVRADTLENGDQVVILDEKSKRHIDYLENVTILKETDTVVVRGLSEVDGDMTTYFLPWDAEVGLWTV